MIVAVNNSNIKKAAAVLCASWQASHASFCSPEFILRHDNDHFINRLSEKLDDGWSVYALDDDGIKGVISQRRGLIEDLYVHPQYQRMGYGHKLLLHAVNECADTPSLWILENNVSAERFYRKHGFVPSGRINTSNGRLKEIEYLLSDKTHFPSKS